MKIIPDARFVHTNFDIYVFISQFLAAQTSKVPKYVKHKSIALYDTYLYFFIMM
jgi:hypothetical protein